MVAIPGGTFMMGSNDGRSAEKPVHRVTVSAFCMDVTEVTVDAYRGCSGCTNPETGGYCNWGKSERGSHPVNCVDWNQATKYCESQGKRLPTEEEWEYAARGGSRQLKYSWGSESASGRACFDRYSSKQGTCAVGSYDAGAFGLKDMAGNVWEWTSSGWSEDYSKNRASSSRVSRGGGWVDGLPSYLRGANRYRDAPVFRFFSLGFRCARTR